MTNQEKVNSSVSTAELIAAAVREYRQTESLELTAARLHLSTYKVRKLLITAGEWSSPFARAVGELKAAGRTVAEIAALLETSANMVVAYLPYGRTVYNVADRTGEARRSDLYRLRIRRAAAHSVRRRTDEASGVCEYDDGGYATMDKNIDDWAERQRAGSGRPLKTIRLHLALKTDYLDAEDRRALRRYGHSSTGESISRDILIPSDMTLHALHYAIQRLFGWQNSHLRAFELPPAIYKKLTGGTVGGWFRLVGTLFLYLENDHEAFWDDDYHYGSFKNWLRKKYTGPYVYEGEGENFLIAHRSILALVERFPMLDVHARFDSPEQLAADAAQGEDEAYEPVVLRRAPLVDLTLDELNQSLMMECGQQSLLERLTVAEVLAAKGQRLAGPDQLIAAKSEVTLFDVEDWMRYLRYLANEAIAKERDQADKLGGSADAGSAQTAGHETGSRSTVSDDIDSAMQNTCTNPMIRDELRDTIATWAKRMRSHLAAGPVIDDEIIDLNPLLRPVTHQLIYNYDFGDNWIVEITRLGDAADLVASGALSALELAEAEATVLTEHRPVCIARDGLNVLDDVGGLSGFARFLATINESDDMNEREELREWAKSLGWSTRNVALKNVL